MSERKAAKFQRVAADDGDQKVSLKRRLGLVQCVAILVGFMIGSGIYIGPSGVLRRVPSTGVALILWVCGGVVALCCSLTSAELALTYPTAGARYDYLRIFYGDLAGFIHMWEYIFITRPGSNAIKCFIAAQYLASPWFHNCSLPTGSTQLAAAVIGGVMIFLNCANISWTANVQGLLAGTSASILLGVAVTGYVFMAQGTLGGLKSATLSSTGLEVGNVLLAMYYIVHAYSGWTALNTVVEEIKDPPRTIPRAVVIGVTVIVCLYISVNLAYIAVLGEDAIRQSDAVALTFAARTVGSVSWIVVVLIALSTAASLNTGILVGSRVAFAAARTGHIPQAFAMINLRSYAPVMALLLQLVAMMVICFVGDLDSVLNCFMLFDSAVEMMVAYGLLYRRYKEPERRRPLKVPIIFPVLSAAVCSAMFFGPLVTRPRETGIGLLVVLCTSIPYYYIVIRRRCFVTRMRTYTRRFYAVLQKTLYCVPTETDGSEYMK